MWYRLRGTVPSFSPRIPETGSKEWRSTHISAGHFHSHLTCTVVIVSTYHWRKKMCRMERCVCKWLKESDVSFLCQARCWQPSVAQCVVVQQNRRWSSAHTSALWGNRTHICPLGGHHTYMPFGGTAHTHALWENIPSLVKTPATWPTPPISMNISLADCLLASMDSAGHASSHTPAFYVKTLWWGSGRQWHEGVVLTQSRYIAQTEKYMIVLLRKYRNKW